jgi:V/A-type H+-transporting ATPase subunit E
MSADIQALLEQIQKEGVEKAQAEAGAIIQNAQAMARAILDEAEKKAADLREKNDRDAKAFADRSRKSIEQSARDIIIFIRETVQKMMADLVRKEVTGVLSSGAARDLLVSVIRNYAANTASNSGTEVWLNSEQKKALFDYFLAQLQKELQSGVTIKGTDAIVSGFRVSVTAAGVQHDFSDAAIAQTLCQILRPQLAEIVRAALVENQPAR